MTRFTRHEHQIAQSLRNSADPIRASALFAVSAVERQRLAFHRYGAAHAGDLLEALEGLWRAALESSAATGKSRWPPSLQERLEAVAGVVLGESQNETAVRLSKTSQSEALSEAALFGGAVAIVHAGRVWTDDPSSNAVWAGRQVLETEFALFLTYASGNLLRVDDFMESTIFRAEVQYQRALADRISGIAVDSWGEDGDEERARLKPINW